MVPSLFHKISSVFLGQIIGASPRPAVLTYMIDTLTRTAPQPAAPRLLYSRKDAAYMLAESLRSIDYKIATGSLKIIRQGGRVKITHAELLRQAGIDDNTPIVPRRQPRRGTVTAQARRVA